MGPDGDVMCRELNLPMKLACRYLFFLPLLRSKKRTLLASNNET